ncbi:MAG TPA: glycosyltransferase [Bryobacteraceae bacterium]|jgi:UDP-galactopyranose mutase|nr:glycosyltransferase [Bryobacteraceae bacterium]
MSRFARDRRVFFVEEPVFDAQEPVLRTERCPQSGVCVVTPHLNEGARAECNAAMEKLLAVFAVTNRIRKPLVWFYTPMALECFPRNLAASAIVYDCMDELSLFHGAPSNIRRLEEQLLRMADVVFTGGISLFEAKRKFHPRVYPFPSGVDVQHFLQARHLPDGFAEHGRIGSPRLGYAGVIDERIDLPLLEGIARQRPEWQLVMIGPVVKISPDSLPRLPNIHWLGMKNYSELPRYFAGWDVGIMPFALNDSTRFISPTKTPEYLAAGLPVVSTPIRDVVRSYGELGLARIAHSPEEFIAMAEQALAVDMGLKWRERADEFLNTLSWDSVWSGMNELIGKALAPEPAVRDQRVAPAFSDAGATAGV